jgi:hypothetical protein
MTVRRSLCTRLLFAVSTASTLAVASPALAAPNGGADLIATAPLYLPAPSARHRAPTFRRVAYLPRAVGPSEVVSEPSHEADVLPSPRGADQPSVGLAPETAHYDFGPTGLTDDPTTFGLVAKF